MLLLRMQKLGLNSNRYKSCKGDPIYPRFEIPEMVEVVVEEKIEEAVDTSNIPPLKKILRTMTLKN